MSNLVSIVIPTHRPSHFRNALACALAQTYSEIEIIVSDNSDTDEIREMCQSTDKPIIYRKNIDGLMKSNIAQPLSLTSGKYIKYLFDDDLIYPHCIDTMLGWLAKLDPVQQSQVGIITSSRHVINGDSLCNDEIKLNDIKLPSIINGSEAAKFILSNLDNFIGEFSTILFRSEFIDKNNPETIFRMWGEDFIFGLIDVPLYLSIFQTSNLLYIPYSLSAFRRHEGSGSDINKNANFHWAVSDWMRISIAAFSDGYLTFDELQIIAKKFVTTFTAYVSYFREELNPWLDLAHRIVSGDVDI